ncbi:hypothetical protein M9458_034318, partial [Cirrhinus mrigala]
MKSAAFLLLLFILTLSDGVNHQTIDQFTRFKSRHIIKDTFKTADKNAWANLLSPNGRDLCNTSPISFIQGS